MEANSSILMFLARIQICRKSIFLCLALQMPRLPWNLALPTLWLLYSRYLLLVPRVVHVVRLHMTSIISSPEETREKDHRQYAKYASESFLCFSRHIHLVHCFVDRNTMKLLSTGLNIISAFLHRLPMLPYKIISRNSTQKNICN